METRTKDYCRWKLVLMITADKNYEYCRWKLGLMITHSEEDGGHHYPVEQDTLG